MIALDPMLAIEAAVLDTETTGLDPAKARILQIGAVHFSRGELISTPVFDRKINPGVPIPPETTRIHGLDAAALDGAPTFPEVYPELVSFVGPRVLIGHNIGFDLAILERECTLSGARPFWNHILDTRLLGEICFPKLGGFTLDKLASHLGLAVQGRHDALADAELTGRLFFALIPALRAHGIRTLAEAETACRRLTAVLDDYNRAGWSEPVRPKAGPASILGRIDAFPFRHRIRDVANMPPIYVDPEETLGAAIRVMAERGISSVFVPARQNNPNEAMGIITERDVIRLLGTSGGETDGSKALALPVGMVASRPLKTVPAEAFIYRAIGRMEQSHIRHLGVVDEGGAMIGAISARDLLRLRSFDALALGDAIDGAAKTADLAAAWARMPRVAQRLLDEDITTREVAAVISREIGALTRRASQEAEARMVADGAGPAPCAYATLILGSGGRGESLLIPDQDNAVVYAENDDPVAASTWFLAHGALMNGILDEIGIPLCKGNVMAGNPAWNGTLADWRSRITGWTETINPADLLAVDIFFDFRAVGGDAPLAETLRSEALALAHSALPMVKLLADQLNRWSPPLGFLGRIAATDGRVDLKIGGLFPIVAAARCLALSHGIADRSTTDRLRALKAAKIGAEDDLDMLERAQSVISGCILRQQLLDMAEGRPPTTLVDIRRLTRSELAALKTCLADLRVVPTLVHDLLFAH